MKESDEEARVPESAAETARKAPLRCFRLGRYALMLLFAFVAAAYFTPAVTSLAIAIDESGQSEVSLKRMTEGGTPTGGPSVTYGVFLLITGLGVCLVIVAAVAAFFFLGDRTRPTAWTAITVVAIVGVAGALVALALETSEVGWYLASIAVCFLVVVAAGLFELWRARWVRRQPLPPAAAGPGSAPVESRPA